MAGERLSLREKLCYALGDASANIAWRGICTFLLVFYTDVVGLKAAAVATLMLVVRSLDGVTARLDFLDHMLRVAITHDDVPLLPTWSVCPAGEDVPLEGRKKLSVEGFALVSPVVTEDDKTVSFALDGVRFSVELRNFRITAKTDRGVLYRDRSGLAYNFAGELGAGTIHYTDRFEGERVFGLGDKSGPVNKANRRYLLSATDSMGFRAEYSDPLYKHVPFFLCSHAAGSFGLFYDTFSTGAVDFGAEHDNYYEPFHSVRYEEENLVFYLILGTPMEIVRRFSALCGTAAPVPEWAFRYCGSTMEYTDAPDSDKRLRGFLRQCGEHGLRAGGALHPEREARVFDGASAV